MTDKVIEETTYRMLVLPGFDAVLSIRDEAIGQNTGDSGNNNGSIRHKEKCGVKCYTAHGVDCECICGGINHGKAAEGRTTS